MELYIVEWRRYYSDYGYSYITGDIEKAIEVKEQQEEEHPDCDFEIVTHDLNKEIEIWE